MEKRRLRWVVQTWFCILFTAERAARLLKSLGSVSQETGSACAVVVARVPCNPDHPLSTRGVGDF